MEHFHLIDLQIPNASNETTTFVKLSNIEVNPEIAFMLSPFFINKKSKRITFVLSYAILSFRESGITIKRPDDS